MTTTDAAHDITAAVRGWFSGRLPAAWSAGGALDVTVDREEITVVLPLAEPQTAAGASAVEQAQAWAGRVSGFREETRGHRIEIAREAEHRFGRRVAWGVRRVRGTTGGGTAPETPETGPDDVLLFTTLAVPVMTRLRQPQRQVLDLLVQAGVARSRADALGWCVRLVGTHADEWLGRLRAAVDEVDRVRAAGPGEPAAGGGEPPH